MDDLPAEPSRTALVIDDSKLVQVLLNKLLRQLSFTTVETAGTGADGVAQALAVPPSMIFLDHQLPDGYGEQFARQLRAGGVSAPIIAITGTVTCELAESFLAAGADQLLPKPIDPVQLAEAVAACGFEQPG